MGRSEAHVTFKQAASSSQAPKVRQRPRLVRKEKEEELKFYQGPPKYS
jgi:hypothetical protein